MKYCFDTSIFVEAWVRLYPIDHFSTLWDKLDRLIEAGELITSIEVLTEIEKKEDGLHKWIKDREKMFVSLDNQVQVHVKEILAKYPKLIDTRKNRSGADPFVIATAMTTKTVVVTFESGLASDKRPNIPFVCDKFKVRSIGLVDLIKEQGWKF